MGPNSSDISYCEVMTMVGLPASGKTTWAEKWAEEYPEKRFVLLGRNLILDEMKVPGLFCKHSYGEQSDRRLLEIIYQSNQCFQKCMHSQIEPIFKFLQAYCCCGISKTRRSKIPSR